MRVTLASFHVAGQFSVSLNLRPRRVFPVIYGLNDLIMNVSRALGPRKLFSKRFTKQLARERFGCQLSSNAAVASATKDLISLWQSTKTVL